jgi:uncharacterized cupin superfamily protein
MLRPATVQSLLHLAAAQKSHRLWKSSNICLDYLESGEKQKNTVKTYPGKDVRNFTVMRFQSYDKNL